MVTDKQVRRLMKLINEQKTLAAAAAKAGMDEKTARKWRNLGKLPGEIKPAQIFVAVLGASNYTFAEATGSQDLFCWTGSHVRAFNFFGGVPRAVVPDNLKSGILKSCRYEPDLNPAYAELAAHYATTVIPARPVSPRDKAKVESGVLIVERWILARLRNLTFFSLAELNLAIAELVT